MMPARRPAALAAGILGFAGVALGAFGAHTLKDLLAEHGMTQAWETAVLYHLLHSVALLAIANWTGGTRGVAGCWIAGIVLFSGSLYWLALGGPKFLGPVTPLGGLFLLAGWVLLAWTAWQRRSE